MNIIISDTSNTSNSSNTSNNSIISNIINNNIVAAQQTIVGDMWVYLINKRWQIMHSLELQARDTYKTGQVFWGIWIYVVLSLILENIKLVDFSFLLRN